MTRKLVTVAVLAAVSLAGVFAAGCATDDRQSGQPYSLTGQADDKTGVPEDKPWLNPRYVDSKGHYHAEWVGQNGR